MLNTDDQNWSESVQNSTFKSQHQFAIYQLGFFFIRPKFINKNSLKFANDGDSLGPLDQLMFAQRARQIDVQHFARFHLNFQHSRLPKKVHNHALQLHRRLIFHILRPLDHVCRFDGAIDCRKRVANVSHTL
ncbi:hypothetical protein BpHYR1_046417 [Brachionus plicatilis]|uniref:Uncharacterized protein n=1 Tax=Brachionus plicatilis TaxID=10195 RepID=A0A3M7PPZ8_BRAPC|nr:hypothetical protein BpHYR1_046417 [Brachionus plicatilis]